jgi:hypothetical protein
MRKCLIIKPRHGPAQIFPYFLSEISARLTDVLYFCVT